MSDPAFELDHVFVAVGRDAPELDDLRSAGFEEGAPNVHRGQGTACRRLFFDNVYLEFMWLESRLEASAPRIARTGLAARAGLEHGVSRLGVALRPVGSAGGADGLDLPVRTWRYEPPYLPEGMAIPVAVNSTVMGEPLLFFMTGNGRWSEPRRPHPNGARAVREISITVIEGTAPSPEMRWLRQWGGIRVEAGSAERVDVWLDGADAGRSLTLGAETPVTLRW